LAVPPLFRAGGVGADQRGSQVESVQVLLDSGQALFGFVDGYYFREPCAGFENRAGFATRGGAGVENPLAGLQIQQRGAQLGGFVLNTGGTVIKPGQAVNRYGMIELYAKRCKAGGRSANAGFGQQLEVVLPAEAQGVD